MFHVEHTRTQGKRLTYDIETFRDGSYIIRLDGRILRRGMPDPQRGSGLRVSGSMAKGVERGIADIEALYLMEEVLPPVKARLRRSRGFRRTDF
jgi:hypothetical protein